MPIRCYREQARSHGFVSSLRGRACQQRINHPACHLDAVNHGPKLLGVKVGEVGADIVGVGFCPLEQQ